MLQESAMQKTSVNNGLLTTEEVARLADMSRQALRGHVDAGRLKPFVVLGGRALFARADVQAWLRDRKKRGTKKRGPQPQSHQ